MTDEPRTIHDLNLCCPICKQLDALCYVEETHKVFCKKCHSEHKEINDRIWHGDVCPYCGL